MKIGALEIYWHPGGSSIHKAITSMVKTYPPFHSLVAKMARSEVKNYIAELAEQAERPFNDPAQFLRDLKQ